MTYEARIVEHYSRRVIIEASSADEAEEILDYLCSDGEINLNYDDFNGREVEIIGSIVRASKPYLRVYGESGEIG